MKNGVASKNKNMYLKINMFILTVFINQTSPLCHSGQCCHYTETIPLIYRANQWDGFYTMPKLDWNKLSFLNVRHRFLHIYFLLSWKSLLPFPSPFILHKNITPRTLLRILIKLYKLNTYSDFLKENNLNLKGYY